MACINDIVLVHGWGLNKAVWSDYIEALNMRFNGVRVHAVDIPGYGDLALEPGTGNLRELADACLEQAPPNALWIGWSLGGMIAMQAALLDLERGHERIQGLQLINSTPKFVQSDDWLSGVDIRVFENFCRELASDYHRTLGMFLLLQAGSTRGARQLARDAQSAIKQYHDPSEQTLSGGISCLANSDLRSLVPQIQVPCQIVLGELDRVTKPASSKELASMLGADLVQMHSGHAPFLTDQTQILDEFERFITQSFSDGG